MTPLFYRSSFLYNLLMRVLYKRRLKERGEAIARHIAPGSSVLDMCCGTAELFRKHLRQKNVTYLGVDLNPVFIRDLQAQGIHAVCADALNYSVPAQGYDYIVLQGSLSEFPISKRKLLVDRLHQGARRAFLLSESVRHLIHNANPWIQWLATRLGRPLQGEHEPRAQRYGPEALREFMEPWKTYVQESQLICGGRTLVYVLRARTTFDEKKS